MRGKNTDTQTIYAIMGVQAITNNCSETARLLNMPERTVNQIYNLNKDKEEFAKLRQDKKKEFSQKATIIIDTAMDRLQEDIENKEEKIPVNHLVTVIDKLCEKRALADGEATQNTKVIFELPEEVAQYAE